VTLLGLFDALSSNSAFPAVIRHPHSDSGPGELCPLAPLVTPRYLTSTKNPASTYGYTEMLKEILQYNVMCCKSIKIFVIATDLRWCCCTRHLHKCGCLCVLSILTCFPLLFFFCYLNYIVMYGFVVGVIRISRCKLLRKFTRTFEKYVRLFLIILHVLSLLFKSFCFSIISSTFLKMAVVKPEKMIHMH